MGSLGRAVVVEQNAKDWFAQYIHEALTSLYDPSVLRYSPLIELLGIADRRNVVMALREALSNELENLQPDLQTPQDSKVWRIYHILRRRYIEQVTQGEVARDLGLSTRQLQRDESLARKVLVDHLWDVFGLGEKVIPEPGEENDNVSSLNQELEHLRNTSKNQAIDVNALLWDIVHTLEPLFRNAGAVLTFDSPPANAVIYAQAPILRQALINLMSMAIQLPAEECGEMQVGISIVRDSNQMILNINIRVEQPVSAHIPQNDDSQNMIDYLLGLCGGTLEIGRASEPNLIFSAEVRLPPGSQTQVLVIDDNDDTRKLFEKYLEGTPYRFWGIKDGHTALDDIIRQQPALIVLDVMMPDQDGWELLGKLREHPQTRHIPVIICTILPQEQLAYALGAAEFIRKPISQKDFLSLLDHLLASGSY